ncbi:MAG: CpsB/CapC family capsule biosynthesis tyrosine phosphatase [Desulfocapsaceae bacterium]|nr:CpsB/CapC family capsule biosynthesis tyrosine phosphatase [Desulfocapsaceae bacterium]
MIDLHCHILPGIDDGSPNMETSLAMAKMALEDGIHTIIATPHLTDNLTKEALLSAVAKLREALKAAGISITILSGAEVPSHMALAAGEAFCLADSTFLLLEFPYNYLPIDSAIIVEKLLERGITPVIAHPERNPAIYTNPLKLAPLINIGAQAQITAASLIGELGVNAKNCAEYLLKHNQVHYLATDSHAPGFRKPILSKAVKQAAKIIGNELAIKLVTDNPAALIRA